MSLYVSFGLYLLVLVLIGVLAYGRSRSMEDFVLGGRRLGAWVTAISAKASDMSGWLLLGLPGQAFTGGVSIVWAAIGCTAGTYFNWTVLAGRLRRYSELLRAITVPDFLESRFGGQAGVPLRIISLAVVVVFYTLYIAAQFKAAGKTVSVTFDVSYHEAVLVSASVIILYTMLGGFLAVAWTDLLQGLLMVVVVLVLPIIGLISLGGFANMADAIIKAGPHMLSVSGGKISWELWITLIIGNLAWALGYPGQPHIVIRYMAIRRPEELRKSALISVVWVVLALWGAMCVGLIGAGIFGPKGLSDPETVLVVLAQRFFPGWLAGIAISAMAAAIMSTVDSQILVLTSAAVEDFYRRLINRAAPDRLAVILSRTITLAIGVLAVFVTWNSESGVFRFVQYAWGGLAAGFGPVLIMSLRWKRTTGWGAAAGMTVGLLTVIIWHNVPALAGLVWELIPAFIFSLLAIVLVSFFTGPPRDDVMEQFQKSLQ
jgi:sodium/proline symporter